MSVTTGPRRYRLFGLVAVSDLPLPLVARSTAAPVDVTVARGAVTPTGRVVFRDGPPHPFTCRRTRDAVVLDWPEARFRIEPARVTVDTAEPRDAADLLTPAVWSVLLSLRGQEAFHGSAVALEGRALAMLGATGSGKSTAALALLDRGGLVVTDDLVLLDPTLRVVPGPPVLRLCSDRAAGRPGRIDTAGKLRMRAPVASRPVPLTAIVVLDGRVRACGRLGGAAAATALLEQVYNPLRLSSDQLGARFALALRVADRVPVYVAPPRSLDADQLLHLLAGAVPCAT